VNIFQTARIAAVFLSLFKFLFANIIFICYLCTRF